MSTVNFDGATNSESLNEHERKAYNLEQLSQYGDEAMMAQLAYHVYDSKSGYFPPVPGQPSVKTIYQVSGSSSFNNVSSFPTTRPTNTDSDSSIMNKIKTQVISQITDVTSNTDTTLLKITDAQKTALGTMIDGTDGTDVVIQYFINGKPHTKAQMISEWKAGRCKNKFAYVKNAGDKLIKEIKVSGIC